jgi:hypothetical protein
MHLGLARACAARAATAITTMANPNANHSSSSHATFSALAPLAEADRAVWLSVSRTIED